jgi:hypothetical protein
VCSPSGGQSLRWGEENLAPPQCGRGWGLKRHAMRVLRERGDLLRNPQGSRDDPPRNSRRASGNENPAYRHLWWRGLESGVQTKVVGGLAISAEDDDERCKDSA